MPRKFLAYSFNGTMVLATNTTAPFDLSGAVDVLIAISVESVSGTLPTLTLVPQTSPDGGITWYDHPDVVAIPQFTGVAKVVRTIRGNVGPLFKFNVIVGGTAPIFGIKIFVLGSNPDYT